MNMIPQFLKWGETAESNRLAATNAFAIDPPLDLDPDFEEACARSLQEPMQTDEQRTVEVMENLVTLYADKVNGIESDITALEKALSAKRGEKQATERMHAWAKSALADLKYDPADDAKRSYDLAVEVKRQRGDTSWPKRASEETQPVSPSSSKRKKGAA